MVSSLDRAVLKHCIDNKANLARCVGELEPKFFEEESAELIFGAMKQYYEKSKKCVTANVLEDLLEEDEVKGEVQWECRTLLEELIDEEASEDDEFEHDLGLFKTAYVSRAWDEVRAQFTGDPAADYERFKKEGLPLFQAGESRDQVVRGTVGHGSRKLFEEYEEVEANPELAYGIRTGFSVIDGETLGMHPGEMWLISGRHGAGKSVMLLNIAVNAYKAGKKVMIFSLEMPFKQYLRRFHACYSGLEYRDLKAGTLTKDQKKLFKDTIQEVERAASEDSHDLHIIDIPQADALSIEAEIYRAVTQQEYRPDVIVVDYLGIMKSIQQGNADWQEQGYASEELRKLARRLEIPVVTASQLNRDKKHGKGTGRISRADQIGATVDVFLQIEEKTEEEEELSLSDDTAKIYIGKCRDGRADQSFLLWKCFRKMQMKDKDTFKTPEERLLDSFEEVDGDFKAEFDVKEETETEADKSAKQSGDFIDL